MRIFFTNAFFPLDRYEGSRVHIEQLTKNLKDLGHEVWAPPESPLSYGKKLSKDRWKRAKQIMSMDVFYTRIEGRVPKFYRYMRVPWRLLFNKPLIWEINAAPDLNFSGCSPESNSEIKATDCELKQWAERVSVAICNTDGLVQYAGDLGIRNARRIELGSDPDMFSPQVKLAKGLVLPEDKLNVFWCGNASIVWHDFETILKAAAKLQCQSGIRFYIIGSLPTGLDLPSNTTILDSVPYTEMPAYMAAMDVGLAIYRKDTWSRYGVFTSPLKLFDYCASGLFVVASPIEQVKRCIIDKENGFVVPFGDHDALAECLLHILYHKSEIEKIRHRARTMVLEYYNWKRVARETEETIRMYC